MEFQKQILFMFLETLRAYSPRYPNEATICFSGSYNLLNFLISLMKFVLQMSFTELSAIYPLWKKKQLRSSDGTALKK